MTDLFTFSKSQFFHLRVKNICFFCYFLFKPRINNTSSPNWNQTTDSHHTKKTLRQEKRNNSKDQGNFCDNWHTQKGTNPLIMWESEEKIHDMEGLWFLWTLSEGRFVLLFEPARLVSFSFARPDASDKLLLSFRPCCCLSSHSRQKKVANHLQYISFYLLVKNLAELPLLSLQTWIRFF